MLGYRNTKKEKFKKSLTKKTHNKNKKNGETMFFLRKKVFLKKHSFFLRRKDTKGYEKGVNKVL